MKYVIFGMGVTVVFLGVIHSGFINKASRTVLRKEIPICVCASSSSEQTTSRTAVGNPGS